MQPVAVMVPEEMPLDVGVGVGVRVVAAGMIVAAATVQDAYG